MFLEVFRMFWGVSNVLGRFECFGRVSNVFHGGVSNVFGGVSNVLGCFECFGRVSNVLGCFERFGVFRMFWDVLDKLLHFNLNIRVCCEQLGVHLFLGGVLHITGHRTTYINKQNSGEASKFK